MNQMQWGTLERTYLVLNPHSLYIEIYVFRGNFFQFHILDQSYHQTQPFKLDKYNTK